MQKRINLFDLWVQHGTPGLSEDSDSFEDTIEVFLVVVKSIRSLLRSIPEYGPHELSVNRSLLFDNTVTDVQAEEILRRSRIFKVKKVKEVKKPVTSIQTMPNVVDILTEKAKDITPGSYFTNRSEDINKRASEIRGITAKFEITKIVKKESPLPPLTKEESEVIESIIDDCPSITYKPRNFTSYTIKRKYI
ncbi:hypothetical protein SRABI13_00461 [Erwinia aphidicola]|uniref:hypothetical protein n=1 Tax=Erwinia aphidicola TaxID=68334 RepID=UPI001D55588E|nr:hypothetical protein [Erwinia aphidicola]CAH0148330.1 hypothetical protein SRABI13_00461 [Erwinia aphidicola]